MRDDVPNLTWRMRRLRAMNSREMLYRAKTALRSRLEYVGVGLAKPGEPGGVTGKSWLAATPKLDSSAYRAAADRVLAGRYHLFAQCDAHLGFPPQWNRDPKTGTVAPLEFGKTLNYRDTRRVGDIKYLWEPNRHLELVTLAQAWRLSGDPRYVLGARRLLESWLDQCPYALGVNWSSSLELAIRLLNWSCAWHLLGGEGSELFAGEAGESFRSRWYESIYRHAHFIVHHLSRHSSANNHLLGEWLGLFAGCVTWPLWQESAQWAFKAQRGFESEALLQNWRDGVNKEQATWYHHEVADMMLIAGLIARASGGDFSAAFWQRWESMLDYLASIMDVAGNVPAFGDSDDAVMLRLSAERDFNVHRSLLASGAVLLNRAALARKARRLDDKSRWLLGDESLRVFASLHNRGGVLPVRRTFPQGGYYILGSDFESAREVRIVADAAPLGYLSIAAHGHADALSFTLSVAGHEVLIDPGTYAYHTEKSWRDYFRGTSAHNTLRIDGLDQSVPGGNFLWSRHARCECRYFEAGATQDILLAEHDGYLRLHDPLRHRRKLVYEKYTRILTVEDELVCRGSHRVELFWHFGERCRVNVDERGVTAVTDDLQVSLSGPPQLNLRLARGEISPPAGWRSQGLDLKQPCTTVIFAGEIRGNWTGLTRIAIAPDVRNKDSGELHG